MLPLRSASTRGARALGLASAALFVVLFLGLYRTMRHPGPASPTPSLGDAPAGPGFGRIADADADATILYNAPATYPRLTRLSDGAILLAFTRVDNTATPPQRHLTVHRSVDDGRTFAPWGEVTRCDGDCGNLFLLEVPAAAASSTKQRTRDSPPRVLAAFRNHDYVDPVTDRKPAYFRITVCESLDGGKTWTYLTQAAEKPAPWGLWEPFMRLAPHRDNELQLLYSRERKRHDQDTVQQTSRDGGATWSAPRTVTGADEALRDGMTGVAATYDYGDARGERRRPALVMVMETTRRGTFSVEAVVSYDDGVTWGHRQAVVAPAPGANAGAPQVEAFENGGLAAVFMTDADTHDGRQWPDKASVKVVWGGPLVDGQIQWSEPQVVCPRPSFWPGIFKMNAKQLMVVCEHQDTIQGRMLESG